MSPSISPVVLILGAGSNIGAHVARAFATKGYKVALAARKLQDSTNAENHLTIRADFADPSSMSAIFAKVKASLGAPSVVVYNAAKTTANPPIDPLSLSITDLAQDMTINTTSALAAAHHAVLAFADLPETAPRTFIYTGNALNTGPILPLLSLGMGKSASAHMIASAAVAYAEKGYKFYYADERKADGTPAGSGIDGQAHGEFYVGLAEGRERGDWHATFVKGVGFVKFAERVNRY